MPSASIMSTRSNIWSKRSESLAGRSETQVAFRRATSLRTSLDDTPFFFAYRDNEIHFAVINVTVGLGQGGQVAEVAFDFFGLLILEETKHRTRAG